MKGIIKIKRSTMNLVALIFLSGLSIVPAGAQTAGSNTSIRSTQINVKESDQIIELSQAHIDAVNRRRRIVLQYDAWRIDLGVIGTDFKKYINGTFKSVDQTGNQIDAIWWDIGAPVDMADWPNSTYQKQLGEFTYMDPELKKWWDQGIDWIEELVGETKKRELEVFWNHRIAEICYPRENPFEKNHPEYFVQSHWYSRGLWNLASPEVRQYKVDFFRELLQRYEFDGIQIDFARHTPILEMGHQWEQRAHVTEFIRMVRTMMIKMERELGRPLLLAVKVPVSLEGCRVDGFDVETWAAQNLVDIFTLGNRSIDVDLEAYRRIAEGHHIKLQPCWDDHHSAAGYRGPSLEIHRGIFGNWWHQGADGIVIFNWFVDGDTDYNVERLYAVAEEAGSPETLYMKDKTFVVERRGGWGEFPQEDGFIGRNHSSPLPKTLAVNKPVSLSLRISDNLRAYGDKIKQITLRTVFFGAKEGDEIGVRFNGVILSPFLYDYKWKDNQIFSPHPERESGYPPNIPVDPEQKLLRIEFRIKPGLCRLDENQIEIFIANREPHDQGSSIESIVLEKLELHVDYK